MRFRHSWLLEVILILVHLTEITGWTTDSTRGARTEIYAKTTADSSEEENDESYYTVKDLKVELVDEDQQFLFTWTAPINDKNNFKEYSHRCDSSKSALYKDFLFWTFDAPRDIKPGRIQSFETRSWLNRGIKVYCALRAIYYKKSILDTRSYLSNIVKVTSRNYSSDSFSTTTIILLYVLIPIAFVSGIIVVILMYVRLRRRGARLQASRMVIMATGQGPPAPQPNACHWPEQSQQHPTSIENRPPPYKEFEHSSHKIASPNDNSAATYQARAPNAIGNAEYPQQYEYGPSPVNHECIPT